MKRSESMLVYGVTAILVVIVGFAVVLGDEAKSKETDQQVDVGGLFPDENPNLRTGGSEGGDQPGGFGVTGGGDEPGVGTGGDDLPIGPAGGDEEPKPITLADLGRSTVINTTFDGRMHRQVVVQSGDTFSQLVQTWAPGHTADDVLALNETLDPGAALPINSTILMPHVEDQKILDRHIARLETSGPRSMQGTPVRPAPGEPAAQIQGADPAPRNAGANPSETPTQPASLRGTVHEVKEGEALWTIAARVVGAGKALDYCEQIKRENSLSSDTIRTGMKLKLP